MKKIFWGLIFLSGFLTLTSCVSPEVQARKDRECNSTIYPSYTDRVSCRMRISEEIREQKLALQKEAEQVKEEAQQQAQRVKEEEQRELRQRKVQAYVNDLKNYCKAFGFNEGTDALSNCMMNQHRLTQQQAAKEQADANAAWSNAMNAIANYKSPSQKMQEQQQQNYNIQMNCRTIRTGNVLQTQCD